MKLFEIKPYTKADLRCSREEAIANLVKAATELVKKARWYSFYPDKAKINELRKPLLQLKLAK